VEIVLAALGALVVVLALVFIIGIVLGRRLPVGHVASRSATLAATPQRVWDVINDPAFMRTRGVGDVKTEIVESVPPRRLVRRIVGESDSVARGPLSSAPKRAEARAWLSPRTARSTPRSFVSSRATSSGITAPSTLF